MNLFFFFFLHMTFLVHRAHLLIMHSKGNKIFNLFIFFSEATEISERDLKLGWWIYFALNPRDIFCYILLLLYFLLTLEKTDIPVKLRLLSVNISYLVWGYHQNTFPISILLTKHSTLMESDQLAFPKPKKWWLMLT